MTEVNLTSMSTHKQPMMSSREIAEITCKQHKEVCRDIRVMLVQLYGGVERQYIRSADLLYETNQGVSCFNYDSSHPNGWEYQLDRRHTEILVTGYDIKRRAAVIDRWFALESGNAKSAINTPTTYIEALEALLQSEKEKILLTDERDEAIRTKARISQKREATACQRNSVYQRIANRATKERDEMAALLGASKEYASVRSVWRTTGIWYRYRPLIKWQDEHDAMETFSGDPESDVRVLCYPLEAWLDVYGVDIAKLF